MKSITKMMLVAMVLVAALVVAPAAARNITTNGTNVYVGEENLNLTVGSSTGATGTLVYYSSVSSPSSATIGKTIAVDGITFELTPTDVGSSTGAWYFFQTGSSGTITNPSAANGYVLVQNPSATLGVNLAGSTDSVNGETVTRTSEIEFQIVHNLAGLVPNGTMDIEVTTPSGGKLQVFGSNDIDLRSRTLSGQKNVTAPIQLVGITAGTYTAQAKWPSISDFYGKGYDSNTVTFEVAAKALGITSSKDTVVRGTDFLVTISGESSKDYYVSIRDAGIAAPEYPAIAAGQPGVNATANPTITGSSVVKANVTTNAAGTRSVLFNTNETTDDRTYTIRVQDPSDSTTYEDVKVRVEKGTVTVTASGSGVYYVGEEVTLSGTNTESETIYLFLTGPNLGTNGVKLDDVTTKVMGSGTTYANNFTQVTVEGDDTWSTRWNTGNLIGNLNSGGYTIYAVSTPNSKSDLSGTQYATVGIQLRSGFISATTSGATIAKGDDLTITGTAQGNPDNVYVWIFGKNFYGVDATNIYDSTNVESDGSFEYDLEGTKDLSSGQYFVIIQHPMGNGIGVETNASGFLTAQGITPVNLKALQASEAANALITALDSPYVDDTYTKLTFVVEEAQIFIDAIGDKAAGSKFTITGTTNLAVGDDLIVDVTSAAFQPTSKTETSGFSAASGTATVQQGDGANTWSFEVDGSSFKPDQYIVRVESIDTDTTQTATFNVIEAVPTTQATPTSTATGEVTPTATATTEATPTQSPGFGALLALAGLGAVAFLVLRRD